MGVDIGPRKDGESGDNNEGFSKYRALVGSLIWLPGMTRLDIANELRACARHCHNPSPCHWKVLLQVSAYENARFEVPSEFWFDAVCVRGC